MKAASACALVAAVCAAAVTPVIAQEEATPMAAIDLECGDISTLEAAHAAALVYYIAGYADGRRDAGITPAPASTAMIGGLTMSAAAVLDACAASADSLVLDIIASQGGSGGTPTAPSESAPADGAAEPPADGTAIEEVPDRETAPQ